MVSHALAGAWSSANHKTSATGIVLARKKAAPAAATAREPANLRCAAKWKTNAAAATALVMVPELKKEWTNVVLRFAFGMDWNKLAMAAMIKDSPLLSMTAAINRNGRLTDMVPWMRGKLTLNREAISVMARSATNSSGRADDQCSRPFTSTAAPIKMTAAMKAFEIDERFRILPLLPYAGNSWFLN